MRFMMLMIPKGYETAAPDVKLDPQRVVEMMKYNQALQEAGVLITLDGLHPPSMGARVSFAEIETDRGHDAFLLDVPEFFDIARAFLHSAGKARGLTIQDG